MNIEKMLKLFENENIELFEVSTPLDMDEDTLLENENFTEFIRLCKATSEKVAYYQSYYHDECDYYIDVESITIYHQELLEEKFNKIDNINSLPNLKLQTLPSTLLRQIQNCNSLVSNVDLNIPYEVDIFIIYNGQKVGCTIILDNTSYEQLHQQELTVSQIKEAIKEFYDNIIDRFFTDLINKKYEINSKASLLKNQERTNRINKTLDIIKQSLYEDDELKKCSNRDLRYTYSKKLAAEYSQKTGERISIRDVVGIVNLVYSELTY